MAELSVLEVCAGAGGQSAGLEKAGFHHEAAIEIDRDACATLRLNRPNWHVIEDDVRNVEGRQYGGVDVVAGGVPCPPFSMAGKQLGQDDERDLFPEALRLVRQAGPRAVLLENVRGLGTKRFDSYRAGVIRELEELGYRSAWETIHASGFGVPQLRPRFILVAMRPDDMQVFQWPEPLTAPAPTVGDALRDLMAAEGWTGASAWALRAAGIGPTIVGGSKKHGGADLGPTRAKLAWKELSVDGMGIADSAPGPEDPAEHLPRLTNRMVARLQGFEDSWDFAGKKTSTYRQIGNAWCPPVARAVGLAIRRVLEPGLRGRTTLEELLRAS